MDDTIFALSSGAPPAAIAIIRISGAHAFDAVRSLAGRLPAPRKASLAKLRHPSSADPIDEALVLLFPGPNSATGEDLAELHVHGGRAVVRAVEDAIDAIEGLRKAEPGEFTRRAFANGRMDLNEVEGLSDLLVAETEWQRRAANKMFDGSFSKVVENTRQDVLRLSALAEAELDFSDEDDVDSQNYINITNSCLELSAHIDALLNTPSVERLKDGLQVVLAGPPNVGKSTLLNALVGRDAAIVSEIAGTTRDKIEVPVSINGVPLIVTDTAGLRDDSADVIEQIGIDRSYAALKSADIVLWLGANDAIPDHPQVIVVATKSDLRSESESSQNAIRVSALTGEGMAVLTEAIHGRAKTLLPPADGFALNSRQREHLSHTAIALRACADCSDWLIIAENLRQARRALDALTGRAHTEELLDTVFGKFCIGK